MSETICKGMNCSSNDGTNHSPECEAEHAAAIAGGYFVKPESSPAPVSEVDDEKDVATETRVSMRYDELEKEWRRAQEDDCFSGIFKFHGYLVYRLMELESSYATEHELRLKAEKEVAWLRDKSVSDGCGSTWGPCEEHHIPLQVNRPGDARCPWCELESAFDRAWERAEKAEKERGEYLELSRLVAVAMGKLKDDYESQLSTVREVLGPDAAGRSFEDLLRQTANVLNEMGGGPLADCLLLKAEALSTLRGKQ